MIASLDHFDNKCLYTFAFMATMRQKPQQERGGEGGRDRDR